MTIDYDAGPPAPAKRALVPAMLRGALGQCPHCGKGRMFSSFLKVAPACSSCDEAFHHHRADDFPAYVTIFIVGHLVMPALMWVELHIQPELWIHFVVWPLVVIIASLVLLQPIKGAIVALQWALRMHGFDPASSEAREAAIP